MKNNLNPERGRMAIEQLRRRPFDRMVTAEEMHRMPGNEEARKRTRAGKVFSLGRGLYQAVLYPENVHFKTRDGSWQEINNTLAEKQDKDGVFLQNQCNDALKVTLRPADKAETVSIENEEGQRISWKLVGACPVSPQALPCECPRHAENDLRRDVLDHLEGEALYADILPGVDMKCRIKSDEFKDEWIFARRESAQPLVLRLTAPGLSPQLLENGEIEIRAADGSIPFALPSPFMVEQNDFAARGAVRVELHPCNDTRDQWNVVYMPDAVWLDHAAFPVILDPVVITRRHSSAIEDNYVTSISPDTVKDKAYDVLRVTKNNGTWGDSHAYLRFLDEHLPDIDSSYYITKAELTVRTSPSGAYGLGSGNNPASSASVAVYEVLGPWTSGTITYNNAPALSAHALDYVYMQKGQDSTAFTYDISNLVRKWYTGVNYGVALKSLNSTWINLASSDHTIGKPFVTICYVSLAGLEDYLTYETQSAGRAGNGYISLYNGNLIFEHNDTQCSGNLMPVSVTHYYNSCYHDENAFGCGVGWKTNLHQCLHLETVPITASGTAVYYVYTDGDGTRHHFQQVSSNLWKDQSGLGMELTISGNVATITDKGDTKMVFDVPTVEFADNYANVKMLKSVTDACGNVMTLTANANRFVLSAQDGAGRNTVFAHSSQLNTICPPGYSESGYCGFTYDAASRLTGIWHLDGDGGICNTAYTYDARGLMTSVTNTDGLKLTYAYTSARAGGPFRVSRVEISNGGVFYGGRKYTYGDCLTRVTDLIPNADGTALTEGKSLVYHFNDYGNVVSVNDGLGYAAFTKYSEDLPVNHPEMVSKLQRSVVNLLKEHSFEASGSWTLSGNWSYAADAAYMGNQSIKVTTQGTTATHAAKQQVAVKRGKTYTLSFYAKKSGAVNVWAELIYLNAAGETVYVPSSPLGAYVQTAFSRQKYTFTVPADAANDTITVALCVNAKENVYATAWFDCAQLEEGAVANRYNMLLNGDFTFDSGAHPAGWLANSSNTANDRVYTACTGTKPEGLSANTMRMYGNGYKKTGGIYQDLAISGLKDDVYAAGGWSFNYSKPRKGENFRYNIRVAFLKAGSTSRVNSDPIEWSEEWTDWQFAAGPVIAPCDYTAIRFNVDYERNINYAEFGGLFLHKEEFGHSYTYDEDGNVTSAKNLAAMQSHATYDDHDNLLTYRQPGRDASVKYTMTWGSTEAEKKKHLLRTATSPLGVVQAYSYDDKGNPTQSKTQNSDVSLFIAGKTAYTSNKNYIAAQTDARGKVVTSSINTTTGTLTSVTDPNGQSVAYTYDQNKRVTGVQTAADGKTYKNAYTYAQDKLTQAAHNTTDNAACDVVYHFDYDGAARPVSVKVGTQLLSQNTYNPNGTLQKVTYGNGGKVTNTFDAFKRLTAVRFDNESSDRFAYFYGANGAVCRVEDKDLGCVTTSEYDAANRPMRKAVHCNATHSITTELSYDQYNNPIKLKEIVGPQRWGYTSTFTYDAENRPTLMTFNASDQRLGYVYDGLGRISRRTVNVGSANIPTVYGFLPGGHGTGSTTPLVQTLSQFGKTYTYAYDNVGNITSVSDGSNTVSYAYDAWGSSSASMTPTISLPAARALPGHIPTTAAATSWPNRAMSIPRARWAMRS